MRKHIIISILALISLQATAQNKAIDRLFEKYSDREGFTKVVITKHMFELFSNVEAQEDDDYMNMIKKLNNIRILAGPDTVGDGAGLYQDAVKALPSPEYEEVMSIKEEGKDIRFLIREDKEMITELIMLVKGEGESTIISISGDIDMKSVAKLSKSMGIEGMDQLENVEDKKKQ
jgi:hypothetical protein